MVHTEEFETLLEAERLPVERFVRFQISVREDADDVLQEIFLTAYQKFSQLKNKASFKAWIISIARNKCRDYFHRKAGQYEIPLEEWTEQSLTYNRWGVSVADVVQETLSQLSSKEQQILYLYFWKELPQSEIAKQLHIPLGTVKSRLYTAKQNFKIKYPHTNEQQKGRDPMKKLPEWLPDYQIEASSEAPFSVKWEELMGWFLVPKLGEKVSWGMYDLPSRKCSDIYEMQVTGKAKVHGIEGVELSAREAPYDNPKEANERTFVAQLTDTHCRYLAAFQNEGNVRQYTTFLDEEFLPNWGYGEDNCGNETHLAPKGEILRNGSVVTTAGKRFMLDIVGRYTVTIGGKAYDTVCVMDLEDRHCGVVLEQFLDRNGRTILWRRYNRDDWATERYGKTWSEQLPENERLTIDGMTYVHWYDCITDYIL